VKERLTGAIIVVALLVLLVPELLTGPGSRAPAKAEGAEGAQLRSYTIDLQDDANRQPPPSAPTTPASDEPVGQATPEAEPGSPPVTANVSPPVDDAARTAARPMGSGADTPAATAVVPPTAVAPPDGTVAKPGAGAPPSADDDTPRSAFGPNARAQPEKPATAARPDATKSSDASKAAAAKSESAKAEAARLAAAKAESAKPQPAAKPESSKPDASRLAAAGSRGWAVQLGVFGSRENADRLAKQVKGSGFPVLVNETSGKDGKKLYWVRVGPEAEQAAATALSARLKSAGHRDARVVAYP